MKILSPCISICKTDPKTDFCYGCARTNEEKKIWKDLNTEDNWKKENLKILKSRMSHSQLKIFLKSYRNNNKEKSGLGLGIFIGKTLLEKNFANINCNNSKRKSGAAVVIKWQNRDLFKI